MTGGWLNGWKEIAEYTGYSVRTAKRYHYEYGMPVLKRFKGVIAIKTDLDLWIKRVDLKCTKITRSFHVNSTFRANRD